MAPKIHRRTRGRFKSATYEEYALGNSGDKIVVKNPEYEAELLKLVGEFEKLTLKQCLTRLAQLRGPWSPIQFQRKMIELNRNAPISSIYKALHDLVEFGVLVRVNGGYAIRTWGE